MITKLTLSILLINKLILRGSSLRKKILNLNFEVVILKTLKHALDRFLHGAIQILLMLLFSLLDICFQIGIFMQKLYICIESSCHWVISDRMGVSLHSKSNNGIRLYAT